jgi:hypothetical protein
MNRTMGEISELRRLFAEIVDRVPFAKNPEYLGRRLMELDPDAAASEAQHWADVRSSKLCKAYHDNRTTPKAIASYKDAADYCAYVVKGLVDAGAKPPVDNPCRRHGEYVKPWIEVF